MPNSHDEQGLARMANGTVSVNPTTGATTTPGHIITKNQQVIANDGAYNKALLGYQQGLGKWGLFVAKDNIDVTTNTDLSQFILNSNQDAFKIGLTGTITGSIIVAGASEQLTIPHGLSISPMVMAFFNGGTFFYPLPFAPNQTWSAGGNVVNNTFCYCYADATNIYITSINGSGITRGPYTFRYYALQETAA